MYTIEQVIKGMRRGLENPAYFGRELNRLYFRHCSPEAYNSDGVAVVDEAWDNLVILDACRYDDFAELHDLHGELQSRESRGSHTVEFLEANFAGRELRDTVYVTASPQYQFKAIDAEFHAVENVWDGAGWDEDAGTVRPETMAERAISVADRYPNKRLIVHLIQPHYPFLGENTALGGPLKESDAVDIWGKLMKGAMDASPGRIRAAYRRNLEIALPAVRTLLDTLAGRTVVTADHGNMFGERAFPVPVREWGHPPGLYTDQLVRVPWLVHRNGQKEATTTAPVAAETDTENDPQERLQQLGYLE